MKAAMRTAMTDLRTMLGYLLLAILFVLAAWMAPSRGAEIELRAAAQPTGNVVRLGDLADITAATDAERRSLAAVELVPSPLDGQSKTINQRELQDLLVLRGIAVGNHRFAGSREVRVTKGGAASPKGTIRGTSAAARGATNAVAAAILKQLRDVDADQDWQVAVELSDEQIRRVADAYGRITAAGGAEPWTGRQKYAIRAGDKQHAFTVEAEITTPDGVIVAARALAKGDVIRASDLTLQPAKRGSQQKNFFTSTDSVIGMEAVRPIAAGQVLDANYVQAPVLVRRGDVVTVYAYASGIRIKTTARSRQPGAKGELVEVEAIGGKERYFARVADVQVVEVFANAASVEADAVPPAASVAAKRGGNRAGTTTTARR